MAVPPPRFQESLSKSFHVAPVSWYKATPQILSPIAQIPQVSTARNSLPLREIKDLPRAGCGVPYYPNRTTTAAVPPRPVFKSILARDPGSRVAWDKHRLDKGNFDALQLGVPRLTH